jgi:peptide/nickel transport system substrate-binding protein
VTVVGVFTLSALVAAGCGGSSGKGAAQSPTTKASSTAGGTASKPEVCTPDKAGGTATFGVFSETRGLDPVVSTGSGTTGAIELSALYDTLMRYNPDTAKFEPWLAESFEANSDSTQWTLKLRKGIKFGNGDPLTTAAVKTSIARFQDPKNNAGSIANVLQIADMRIVDDLTMVFQLKESWGTFPFVLADLPGMIINPNVLQQMGKDPFNTNPRGAGVGPYEVVRFAPGEEIRMQAKTDYWGGPVCIGTLRFVPIATDQTRYDALKKGELDAAFLRDPQIVAQAKAAGLGFHGEVVNLGTFLMMNNSFNKPASADVRVRQAAVLAVDPKVLDDRINAGKGLPTSAIIQKDSPISPGVDGPKVDTGRAAQLVKDAEAAGWNGSISLVCSNATPDVGITIQAQLQAVGFKVALQQLTTPDLVKRVFVDHNFEFACSGASVGQASPVERLNRFFGPGNTLTGYSNPQWDAGLKELKAASTVPAIKQALAKLQQIWNDTVPSANLAAVENLIAWNKNVHGLVFNENYAFYFSKAYLTK